ncbi:MAG: rhamnulokinase [Bacteroidales bacterium]|nr:rhamnulokinase [Bacteroidales bacterium]
MSKHTFIAFDLGATSYRTIAGTLEDGQISMEEISRFPNGIVGVLDHYHWDIVSIFNNLKESLAICARKNIKPESIGIDTWGVDFGFLGEDGALLGLPYAYRDPHTVGMMEEYFKLLPSKRVYELTGIQFMNFNSLFQLFTLNRNKCSALKHAKDLLFLPDLLNYLFTGVKKAEFTISTTSQMLNPATMQFDKELFDAMGVPISLMQPVVLPGTKLGLLTDSIARDTGLGKLPVVAVASHDTGSAIAAVPAEGDNWAYLSSGTWSLMGIETRQALINDTTFNMNFTNEGGVEGTFRFLKNIPGMWLLEQCRQDWGDISYKEIDAACNASMPYESFVDPDAAVFANPDSMEDAIKNYCRETGQPIPEGIGPIARCIFESLAMKYRYVLDQLRNVSPHPIEKLHVIGGGARNLQLCQYTANVIAIPVIAGPTECTAMGNLLVQAMGLGYLKSLAEIREVVRNSVKTTTFIPKDTEIWNAAYKKFLRVTGLKK